MSILPDGIVNQQFDEMERAEQTQVVGAGIDLTKLMNLSLVLYICSVSI